MALPHLSEIEIALCRLGYKKEVIQAYIYNNPHFAKEKWFEITILVRKDWDGFTCNSLYNSTEEEIREHIENELNRENP